MSGDPRGDLFLDLVRRYISTFAAHQLRYELLVRHEDYEAEMAKVANDPVTKKWSGVAMPLQDPRASRGRTGVVFHLD